MHQSNALRKLEDVLTEAVDNGNRNQHSGPILLKAMQIAQEPQNIIYFYELLRKAGEEARSLKNIQRIERYLKTLEDLQILFAANAVWTEKWNLFASNIESKGILNTLDALAHFYYLQTPKVLLNHDFLEELGEKLRDLRDEVLDAHLSKEFKKFLAERIEDILRAIDKYFVDGSQGLEYAAKSFVSDLLVAEKRINDNEKKNPILKKVKAWAYTLLIGITSPSLYDVIGAVPDIQEFWAPKIEDLIIKQQDLEQIIDDETTMEGVLEEAIIIFTRKSQRIIEGKPDLKALPAAKENL